MNCITLIAEAVETTSSAAAQKAADLVPIDFIWEQIISLTWFQAVLAISFGMVYLLYGWRIFRALVVISFALIGLFLGMYFGAKVDNQMWGGVLGLILLAVASVPLMKWCVCVLGAVAGGVLTGGLWYAFDFSQTYIWAGVAIGIIAGGMISFIVFKAAVMLFTSLGGSAITAIAVLALMRLYETKVLDPPTNSIQDMVFNQNWFLPTTLIIPTIIGVIMQNNFVKHSHKWEL